VKTFTLAALVALTAAGCTLGPNYMRPEVPTAPAWRVEYPKAADVANVKWWEQYGDPVLNGLIEDALKENLQVQVAAARVEQFRGALGATRSQGMPQVGYGANLSETRASREGQPPIPEPADPQFSLYQASVAASWQLDLFGRVRRLSEAAQAQIYASEQAQRGVVLTLVSDVAAAYIALRGLDRQREIAVATAANFGETARIFDLRFRSGLVSMSEVSQIRSQHMLALGSIPAIEQQIAILENLISLLLGRPSQAIPRGKPITELVAPPIPADLPSTLLQRRPDILQAEQNLIAANANIGAVRTLYYPNISLTGLLGSVSTAFTSFFTGPATAWQIGAGATGPLFTAGGIRGQVRSAEAVYAQAVPIYRQTILNAFRETNNALVSVQKRVEELGYQRERVAALTEFSRLARLRFEQGMSSYFEVLIADNERFAAELAGVRILIDRHTQVVNVYQALGGGWVDAANALVPVRLATPPLPDGTQAPWSGSAPPVAPAPQ
jgi:multidrug efflux system outer membrane protein